MKKEAFYKKFGFKTNQISELRNKKYKMSMQFVNNFIDFIGVNLSRSSDELSYITIADSEKFPEEMVSPLRLAGFHLDFFGRLTESAKPMELNEGSTFNQRSPKPLDELRRNILLIDQPLSEFNTPGFYTVILQDGTGRSANIRRENDNLIFETPTGQVLETIPFDQVVKLLYASEDTD